MRLVVRLLLPLALLFAVARVSPQLEAILLFRDAPDFAGLTRALASDPYNADLHFRLGLMLRDDLDHLDPERAREHLERAVDLNPRQWTHRQELAQLYEDLGMTAAAAAQWAAVRRLNPHAPETTWRVANFHLRDGDIAAALPLFRDSLAAKPPLVAATVALLLKAGVDPLELRQLVPEDRTSRLRLLQVASASASSDPGLETLVDDLWGELQALSPPPTIDEAQPYLARLLERESPARARAAWIRAAAASGLGSPTAARFGDGSEAVWNGDFESELSSGPLDWQLARDPGLRAARIRGAGVDGSAALQLEVEATSRGTLRLASQRLAVEPGAAYELALRSRGSGVVDSHRIYAELADPCGGGLLTRIGPLSDSASWRTYSGSATTTEECAGLLLRLVGRQESAVDRRGAARFWIDEVTLTPAVSSADKPDPQVTTPPTQSN